MKYRQRQNARCLLNEGETMELSDAYIQSFIQPRNTLLLEMEAYAEEHHVPIMRLMTIDALNQLLRIQNPSKILEIGTAIGYSAIRMAEALPNVQIVTIERDTERVTAAKAYIERSAVADRITVIEGDALEVDDQAIHTTFDAVFIDAAKGQYQRFLKNMRLS